MRITKYSADGIPVTSGLIAVTFSATPTGIFDSSVSTSGGIANITLAMDNQSGNTVLASPGDGSSGAPTFRALVAADIPNLNASKINAGTLAQAVGGTGADLSGSTGYLKTAAGVASAQAVPIPIADGGTNATTSQGAINNIAQTTTKGDLIVHNGTNNVRQAAGTDDYSLVADSTASNGLAYKQRLARRYRDNAGFNLRKLDNATLYVTPGMVEVAGTLVEKTAITKLGMATNGDWIGGTSNEANSEFAWVYADANGNIKLHNVGPNLPTPAAAVFTGQINGSPGLNATSIVYDGDTGEGSVTEGMLLLVFSESTYSQGRGRGSGAGGSRNSISAALITQINTGTNTITVEAGHNINLTDNDYLMAVPFGPLLYRTVSGTTYRYLGMMYNNSSGNLEDNRVGHAAQYTANEGSNYTLASSTLTAIDATNMAHTLLCDGRPVWANLRASATNASSNLKFDILIDSLAQLTDDGHVMGASGSITGAVGMTNLFLNILPGTHIFSPAWKTAAGTNTLYAGAGTSNLDAHPQWSVNLVGGN